MFFAVPTQRICICCIPHQGGPPPPPPPPQGPGNVGLACTLKTRSLDATMAQRHLYLDWTSKGPLMSTHKSSIPVTHVCTATAADGLAAVLWAPGPSSCTTGCSQRLRSPALGLCISPALHCAVIGAVGYVTGFSKKGQGYFARSACFLYWKNSPSWSSIDRLLASSTTHRRLDLGCHA